MAINNMDGNTLKEDVKETGLEASLAALQQLVTEKKESADVTKEDWLFKPCPLEMLGKTFNDLLVSYLYWSQLREDIEANTFNISKIMRRLTSLAKVCCVEAEALQDITLEELQATQKAWVGIPRY